MLIAGHSKETFLFINGLIVNRGIMLGEDVQLLPAKCSPSPDLIVKLLHTNIDIGIAFIFLNGIRSQIRVVAKTPKKLAIQAWNSVWDAILISAFLHCEAICNFQCDTPAENLALNCHLNVTNYYLRGFSNSKPRIVSETEAVWLEENFEKARALLEKPAFQNAVHSLWSYRWHTYSRARLAILWSGIEGLFEVDSELVFRLSLYIARFLEPENIGRRVQTFNEVKRFYKQRSQAVHGSKIKGDADACVEESAKLLIKLLRRCVIYNSLPQIEQLVP